MDNNMIYILFICMFVPLMISVPLVQKSSRDIMVYILIGIAAALFIAEVNGILLGVFKGDMYYVTTTVTPITEEVIKAIPVLFYVCMFSEPREKLLSVSFALGIGFAQFENAYILSLNGWGASVGWALVRGFSTAMMHGICTAAVGYGMSYVRLRKKLAVPGTFSLLIMAIIYHGAFNIFVQDEKMKYFGFIMPTLTYIPFLVYLFRADRQKRASVDG